ncbi:C6 finger domain-containingprotein [Purpureocillium lavendulum]|uniref:C6 finger domain-containingprotein n=1 Tax=Purpureocillium lavendulum TaxID=1247861 RepID=A0AB34FC40_9HYPO|nr:C6 finger domain-containingprotein [Purpureocillium lavendulum]
MIRRALLLRDYIERLIAHHRIEFEQQNKSKRGGCRKSLTLPFICQPENQLSDKDWEVIELFAEILGYYEATIKMLEGDGQIRKRKRGWTGSYGNIWDVVQGFEFLLEQLERFKEIAKEFPDPEHFRININLGWQKLNEFYETLSDTPIYYTGLALHPAYRWKWFERNWADRPEWVDEAKKIVHDVWRFEYRGDTLPGEESEEPSAAEPAFKHRKSSDNPFQDYLRRNRYTAPDTGRDGLTPGEDEYLHWITHCETGDSSVDDPLTYWHDRRFKYPNLSRMALDFLTIQPMSAEYKAQADILYRITQIQSSLHVMDERLRNFEKSGPKISGGSDMKQDPVPDKEVKANDQRLPLLGRRGIHYSQVHVPRDQLVTTTNRLPFRMAAEDDMEPQLGPPAPLGEPGIPKNHTTLAGLLLYWEPIQRLTGHHVERVGIRHVSEFPFVQEQHREPLLVHGLGEAYRHSCQLRKASVYGQLSDLSDTASPPPAANCDPLVGLNPSGQVGSQDRLDAKPDFSENSVLKYVQSFKDNILNMHPIIQPKVLHEWIRHFLDTLHRGQSRASIPQTLAVPGPAESTGLKRKRYLEPEQHEPTMAGFQTSHLIPNELYTPPGPPTPKEPNTNHDVIHGLEYFALAIDIMGNHVGDYLNMKCVYANIFAGLYQGQLARPMESFAYVHAAGHKLQAIMRPSLSTLKAIKHAETPPEKLISNETHNQLALAFWTCLQLESDLVAELPLPQSGILSYEDDIPHPNLSLLGGYDEQVLDSYLGQLYLRTHLNRIHRTLYAPNNGITSERFHSGGLFREVSWLSKGISDMKWIPPSLDFQERDGPAHDILGARLRGKYWGAQVITYRPFVKVVLESRDKALDQEIFDLARKGITALIESTRAFHGLGDERPIITNVFGTAHAQWGNLLVLAAAYQDPTLRHSVNGDLLKGLFERTLLFLRRSAAGAGALRLDMLILEGLYQDLFVHNLIYNLLPDDGDQPDVQPIHLQELASLFKRFNVQDKFGMHLIHGHSQLDEGNIMLGTALASVRGCWTKPTSITDIDPSNIHGHIFRLTGNGEMQAYEYREGPIVNLDGVNPAFFRELAQYLLANDLESLLGLQVLVQDAPEMMCEFVLQDHGTVMLDERYVKAWVPFRTTGFALNSNLSMTELKGGESHAKTTKGTHQVFIGGKIGKEDPLMDALRAEDIVY